MTFVQDHKIWPRSSQNGQFDDLIAFAPPRIVLPIFSVEGKMPGSQVLLEGNVHIVPMPVWISFIGVSRFLLAFVAMTLVAATTAIWGNFTAFGLALFTCVASLFIGGYYRIALGYKPLLYNRWAILGLETIGVIFWLVSCVLLALWTAKYNNSVYWEDTSLADLPYNITQNSKRALLERISRGQYHAGVILAAIATGFCGLESTFFLTTLIVFSINLHKHRKAGYPAVFGVGGPQTSLIVTTSQALEEREKARR